jgi:serine/threonine-protein kinase
MIGKTGEEEAPSDWQTERALDAGGRAATAVDPDFEATQAFTRPRGAEPADEASPTAPEVERPDEAADPNATQAPAAMQTAAHMSHTQTGPASGASKSIVRERISTLGDYRLTKKLGGGGMGQVFKARQISLDRDVAVKVLAKQLADNPAFVDRFYREARLMARLDHPHIVRCYGVGQDHGYHYLAMEYLDGGSIQDWLTKLGKLQLGDAVHVVLAAAAGLYHAHEQGMVHRDIKPDNILLTSKGVVKIADLGLAKLLEDDLSLTKTGTCAGTPYYMAPEQATNAKHVDARADIYSLGVMLYCFLTGQLPFLGDTAIELIKAKEKGKYLPARRCNPAIPDRLDLIIDKTMATNPQHRYRSCAELILDLDGLKVANSVLSFCEQQVMPADRSGGARRPGLSMPTRPAEASSTRIALPPSPLPQSPPADAPADAASEWWYIAYRSPQGRTVTRKMRESEVLTLINEEHFDHANTQASRTLKGGYRDLATYREFEKPVRTRMTQAKTQRRTVKLQDVYQQIEEQQAQAQRWRWLRKLTQSATGWLILLVWLALIAAAGYVLFLGAGWLIEWIGEKLRSIGW